MSKFVLWDSVDTVPMKKFSGFIRGSGVMGKSRLGFLIFKGSLASKVAVGLKASPAMSDNPAGLAGTAWCSVVLNNSPRNFKSWLFGEAEVVSQTNFPSSSQYSQQWTSFEAEWSGGDVCVCLEGKNIRKASGPAILPANRVLVCYTCNSPFCRVLTVKMRQKSACCGLGCGLHVSWILCGPRILLPKESISKSTF